MIIYWTSRLDFVNDVQCSDEDIAFFFLEGPRSRSYGRTAALRLIVQLCGEDEHKDDHFFLFFPSNGAPVE
jgi:hypothetical protein